MALQFSLLLYTLFWGSTTMDDKPEQPKNAHAEILFTEFGIVMAVRPVQP